MSTETSTAMTILYPPRLPIAMAPTPLEPLSVWGKRVGVELHVKRDDLTGSTLTGNKVRKLEFLLADAVARGADTVITCGGVQSNHCRATAIAARRLGLDSTLLLRVADPLAVPQLEGNALLDALVGADIRYITHAQYRDRAAQMAGVAEALRARGRAAYVIPEGGSNVLGSWGYVRCVEELARDLPAGPATLVYAAGSGGTGAGLALGVKLLGLPWRVVGVNVCDDRAYFVSAIGAIVEEAIAEHALAVAFAREDLEIVDGYVGDGYARSRPVELALIRDVARAEGIVLDPVYTGKAFFGMSEELRRDPRCLGERVVFIHTGGVFGVFPKAEEFAPLL